MMGFVLLWLFQDFLMVLLNGMHVVPELFLLGVVYRLLSDGEGERLWAIWTVFVGGLIWDLRWIGIPGFFILGNVVVVMLVLWVWNILPVHGRTLSVIFLLLEASQLLPPLLPVLILGGNAGGDFFVWQQICALPAVSFCTYLYSKRLKDLHG